MTLPRPEPDHNRRDDGDQERDGNVDEILAENRIGRVPAGNVDEPERPKAQRVALLRQKPEHGEIPDEDLQEQRDVAQRLDVDGGDPRDDPVGRKPRDSDRKSDDRREDNPEDRDEQRVEQADQIDAAVARRLSVGNERLVDLEAGGVFQDAEAETDALGAKVGRRVVDDPPGEGDDADNQQNLEDHAADTFVVEHGEAGSDRPQR